MFQRRSANALPRPRPPPPSRSRSAGLWCLPIGFFVSAFDIFYNATSIMGDEARAQLPTEAAARTKIVFVRGTAPGSPRPRSPLPLRATMLRRKRACTCATQTVIHDR